MLTFHLFFGIMPTRNWNLQSKKWKELNISASEYRVNDTIRAPKVRLIGADGDNVGVVNVDEARRMAIEADLDLVEVAPNADPPVCRVMDFGKFVYERAKKEREARVQQKEFTFG